MYPVYLPHIQCESEQLSGLKINRTRLSTVNMFNSELEIKSFDSVSLVP